MYVSIVNLNFKTKKNHFRWKNKIELESRPTLKNKFLNFFDAYPSIKLFYKICFIDSLVRYLTNISKDHTNSNILTLLSKCLLNTHCFRSRAFQARLDYRENLRWYMDIIKKLSHLDSLQVLPKLVWQIQGFWNCKKCNWLINFDLT